MSSFIPVLFLCFVFSSNVNCQNTTSTTSATTAGSACSSDPCSNGGTCLDIPNGYICNCEFGYTGQQCNTDVDECIAISPCENGGLCTNTLGSYYCDCQPGYSGNVCQIDSVTAAPLPPVVNMSTTSAPTVPTAAPTPNVAIGCASSPCKNRGVCLDTATGYTCKCAPGFFGNTCDTEIDECASSPCQHKATCVDQINGFTCICQAGWNGTLCQNNIDECVGVTCQHGGTCVDGVNSYTCNCQYGYSGTSCETRIDVDDCRSNPCQHGGTCIDGHFSYTCRCNDYYKGSNCQTACHSVKADVMMLLDASGSVGSTNFHKQLSFVQSVAQSFDIGQNNVHMGVVTFSTAPHSQFDLNHYTNKQNLIHAINKIPYQSGSTHTDSAIDYLINHSFTSRHGDRTDAPNIAVIITDGQSNNRQATIKEANLLHSRGITTVAIGVGSGINLSELNAIASNQSLVFTVPNYGALHTIQGLIDHRICQVHLMHTTQPSTTVYYPTPPSINEVKCEDKLANCYRYGVAACDSFRQWASDNCPKYCQFCKVSGGGAPTFSPIIG